jgi:hypothetical protein
VVLHISAACVLALIGPLQLLAAELAEDLSHGLAHNVGQHVQAT